MAPSVGSSARAEPTRPLIGVSSATQADGGGDGDVERAERAAEDCADVDAVGGVEPLLHQRVFFTNDLFFQAEGARGGGGGHDGQSSAFPIRESIRPSRLPIVIWHCQRLIASLNALDSTGMPCSLAGQPRGGQGCRTLPVN